MHQSGIGGLLIQESAGLKQHTHALVQPQWDVLLHVLERMVYNGYPQAPALCPDILANLCAA